MYQELRRGGMAVRHLALVALGAVARTDAAETAAREVPAHVIVPWEDKEHAPSPKCRP